MNRILCITLAGAFTCLPLHANDNWAATAIRPIDYQALVGEKEANKAPLLMRKKANTSVGTVETLAPYPAPLDQRREAIITALWEGDEDRFAELAMSPITETRGLKNQSFDEVSRALRKFDRRPIRTVRFHPVFPPGELSVWCRHQWMNIRDNGKTGKRGNLNLIFDKETWALNYVRILAFENSGGYLSPPMTSIPNDVVVDREVPKEEKE